VKRARSITLFLLMFVFLIPEITAAAEPEDPYYTQWVSFMPGSKVTLVGRVEDKAGVSAFSQTIVLKEIRSDYLVIEISRNEEKKESIAKKKTVSRFLNKTDKTEFRGQEEIDIAGKKLQCQRYTNTVTDDSGKEMMVFDYWFHPDIPGSAKIVGRSSYDPSVGTMTATQTAVSWEKK